MVRPKRSMQLANIPSVSNDIRSSIAATSRLPKLLLIFILANCKAFNSIVFGPLHLKQADYIQNLYSSHLPPPLYSENLITQNSTNIYNSTIGKPSSSCDQEPRPSYCSHQVQAYYHPQPSIVRLLYLCGKQTV